MKNKFILLKKTSILVKLILLSSVALEYLHMNFKAKNLRFMSKFFNQEAFLVVNLANSEFVFIRIPFN